MIILKDEGDRIGPVNAVDFRGDGVSVVREKGAAVVTVAGGGGGGGGSTTDEIRDPATRLMRGFVMQNHSASVGSNSWTGINAASVAAVSGGLDASLGGRLIDADGRVREFLSYQTAASINNIAGMQNNNTGLMLMRKSHRPVVTMHFRTPPAIPTGGRRYWAGIGNSHNANTVTGGSESGSPLNFEYLTFRHWEGEDSGWSLVLRPKGTLITDPAYLVLGTGIPFDLNTAYRVDFDLRDPVAFKASIKSAADSYEYEFNGSAFTDDGWRFWMMASAGTADVYPIVLGNTPHVWVDQ